MTIDGFLKVPDIPGPSERDGHEGEIEVQGLSFRMGAPHDPKTLLRTGAAALSMMTFTKYYDMSSPLLMKALFDNTPLDEVVFSARRTIEGETSDYLIVVLTNATVMSYEMSSPDDVPDLIEEQVGFGYQTIRFRYGDKHEAVLDVRVTK